MSNLVVTHEFPAWLERGDQHVAVPLDEGPASSEYLWCKRLDDASAEVCCIPFFAYDIGLGDVINVGPGSGAVSVFDSLRVAAGHYVYRVFFHDDDAVAARDLVGNTILRMGLESEWSSGRLLAIDAPNSDQAVALEAVLMPEHQRESLMLETGRSK